MPLLGYVLAGLFAAAAAFAVYGARHCARALVRSERRYDALFRKNKNGLALGNAARQGYARLFDNVGTAILVTRFSGEIVSANTATVRMLGYESEQELRQRTAADLYVDAAVRTAEMKRLAVDPRARVRELPLRRKDGTVAKVLVSVHVLKEEDGAPVLLEGFMTDITDQRRAEERCEELENRLRLSDKLQSLGHLSAGIAHEINTPLQYISDSVHVLEKRIQDLLQLARAVEAPEAAARVGELEAQIARAFGRTQLGVGNVTRIVHALREFSHPDKASRTKTNLNQLLATSLTICRSEYKHVAVVETDLGELPAVWCQGGELSQVFVNLIINAAHAIEQAGRGVGTIRICTRVDAGDAVVTLADTGCGVPESIRHRIFDPFFTTKPIGKGTGQGLAIARSVIVDRHGGTIHLDSEPGQGTTFTIRLPLDKRKADSPPREEAQPEPESRARKHG